MPLVSSLPATFLSGGTFRRRTFDRRRIGRGRLGGVGGILVQPGFEFGDLALEFPNLALKLADDLVAERHVVGKWGGIVAHAARISEKRRSEQEQIRAGMVEDSGNPAFQASRIFRLHGV
jgi:hypothetical protein